MFVGLFNSFDILLLFYFGHFPYIKNWLHESSLCKSCGCACCICSCYEQLKKLLFHSFRSCMCTVKLKDIKIWSLQSKLKMDDMKLKLKIKFSKIEVKVWRWCSKLNDLIRIWALLLQFADTFWRWSLEICIEVKLFGSSLKLKIKVEPWIKD